MSPEQTAAIRHLPQVAFYYPGVIWSWSDWTKNLLLFFDGVALLVTNYMKDRPEQLEPIMASPLRERGLLHILESEILVDQAATEQLASVMANVITSGALDHLAREQTAFHELSQSRLGHCGDPGLFRMIHEELKSRGLVRDSEDGVSVPLHPAVRALVLVLLFADTSA